MAQSKPMQTFLPYADFGTSAAVLDDRRLGKQRVETFQILRALTFPAYAWKNHPAVRMWRGFVPALVAYGLATCAAWRDRGFADTVADSLLEFTGGRPPEVHRLATQGQLPPWLGMAALHVSHRSALVRKEPEHYRRFFPDVPDDLPSLWPSAAFPSWPARRPAGTALSMEDALAVLGFESARPGQAAGVAALQGGRDVLLAMPNGYGGSVTGLLAGLTARRPTLWITPSAGAEPADLPASVEPTRTPALRSREARSAAPGTEPTARPAQPEDLAAVADEVAAAPDFVFLRPAALAEPAVLNHLLEVRPGGVVVDDIAALSEAEAAAVAVAVRRLGGPPILAVTGAADPARRARISATLALVDPMLSGGGFDRPNVWLGVRLVGPGPSRGWAVAELVAAATGAGLVVAGDRAQAERLAAVLARRRLRVGVAVPGMRPARLVTVIAAYRTGRLDALVVTPGMQPDLGRARVNFVHFAGPPADLDRLHHTLGLASPRGEPSASVLLLTPAELAEVTSPGPSAREALGRYAAGDGCRRALLLDHYGEPVTVPCGRCDRCAPEAGPDTSALHR